MLNKRVLIILFLLIVAIGAMSAVGASDSADDVGIEDNANDLSVKSDEMTELKSDGISGDALESSDDGTFTSLQNRIDGADEGSTITLENDYYYNANFGSTDGVQISKSLTINGNGHAIDGRSRSCLLQVEGAKKVVLNNITFKNGVYNSKNEVICIFDADYVEINSCSFIKNYADYGCPILQNVKRSSVVGCTFDDNSARNYGSLCLMYIENSTVFNCTFNDNLAEWGGGIYLGGVFASSVVGCSFDDNLASCGGAIYAIDVYGSSVVDCRFNDNYAEYGGAVLFDYSQDLSINSSRFVNNTAIVAGGAVYLRSYDFLSVAGCSFENNLAKNASAGAIFLEEGNNTRFTSCNFTNNSASRGYGGAVYLVEGNEFHVSSCSFIHSSAVSGGTIFISNTDTDFKNVNISDSFSYFQGGAIASNNSDISLNDSHFKNCFSYINTGGAINFFNGNLNVTGSSFVNGNATYGGAISSSDSNLSVSSSRFMNNSAYQGGAIFIIYGNCNVSDSLFVNSHAFDAGGAILCKMTDSLIVTDNIFLNSTASCDPAISSTNSNEVVGLGNHFEDIYHICAVYTCDLNGKRTKVRDRLNYIVSNDGTFLNTYGEMSSLTTYNDFVSLKLTDPVYPDNSTIFGYYNDTFAYKINLDRHFNPDDEIRDEHLYIMVFNEGMSEIFYFAEKQISQLQANEPFSFSFFEEMFLNEGDEYAIRIASSSFPISLIESTSCDLKVIPSYYDSRDFGYITPVKNQGSGGNCWAFAGVATLEACIKKITDVTYEFSEENVKNLMAKYSLMGLNLNTNEGGYDTMLMAYLANWVGPINGSFNIYDSQTIISELFKPFFQIQNIKFLPARKDSSDNDLIKRAIMDYGAVAITLNWGESGFHAVSLVGWNDNYNNYDSLGKYTKGAWIFKNSWGTDWGDDGFGYLSYATPLSSDIYDFCHAYTFVFNKNDSYIVNYIYDDAGISDYICSEGHIYCANKFVSYFHDSEYLAAFSTYFRTPTDYRVSVYVNDTLVLSQEGYSDAGYYTIPFAEKINVPFGWEFTIMVENCNSGENYFPVCQAAELNAVNFKANTSFVSYDGENWFDLYSLNGYGDFLYGGIKSNTCQVACIKAFTKLDELRTVHINVSEFDSIDLDEKITINITFAAEDYTIEVIGGELSTTALGGADIMLERIDYSLISLDINGKEYYARINGNKAYLTVSFDNPGVYTLTAQYKNNRYTSNVVKFNFKVNKLNAVISASSVSKVYGGSESSVITLKDDKGNLIRDAVVTFTLNGQATKIKTNANGQATIPITLAPKSYVATVSFDGSGKYNGAAVKISIVVKKASASITAKKLTLKAKKTKKYSITLKDNAGRAIKKAKVTLKIKGKTYKATTNGKGKATFKVKFNKKASLKATIKFAGNAYYNVATKKVKITVKR